MTEVNVASSVVVETDSGGREERWPLPTDEASLLRIFQLCFQEYWQDIWFGVIVPGAAWEVAAPNAAERISMNDGYATVDFGAWHFHMCIGEHKASGPEQGRIRKCARAELYRQLGGTACLPASWGIRLYNGRDEQMMTVLLPSPFLTREQKIRDEPAWERLEFWDRLRADYLGLDPDPQDRPSNVFRRG